MMSLCFVCNHHSFCRRRMRVVSVSGCFSFVCFGCQSHLIFFIQRLLLLLNFGSWFSSRFCMNWRGDHSRVNCIQSHQTLLKEKKRSNIQSWVFSLWLREGFSWRDLLETDLRALFLLFVICVHYFFSLYHDKEWVHLTVSSVKFLSTSSSSSLCNIK